MTADISVSRNLTGRDPVPIENLHPAVSILVVDDELAMRNFLQKSLEKHCALIEVAPSVEAARELRRRCRFDLLIIDISLPNAAGVEWIRELREQHCQTDVIFMTAYANLDAAITALRLGASDFILKPFCIEQLLSAVNTWRTRYSPVQYQAPVRRLEYPTEHHGMIGDSREVKDVCRVIERVAATPSSILIDGPSGSGKELAARSLHKLSGRRGEFVPVNCGSISSELLESELFGHAKGAFTGAFQSRRGLFNYADGGTLFLDEIGEMPLSMQAKLLRVLEDRTIRPVGTEREIPIDVRIICATHRNLVEEVAAGRFREDLFYRLNVITIHMPSLAERMEDLPMLTHYFVDMFSESLGVSRLTISEQDLTMLRTYDWPGNIRELKNIVERAMLLGKSLPECMDRLIHSDTAPAQGGQPMYGFPADWRLDDVERWHMTQVLEAVGGNKSEAARRLGVSRKTLERKFHN